jgi:hypothetical protein
MLHQYLHAMTHSRLDVEPTRIAGLAIPNGEGLSKNQRVAAALDGLSEKELAHLAIKFAGDRGDVVMEEAGRKVLESDEPPLTDITRRDVARVFGDDLAGEADLLDMIGRHFPDRARGRRPCMLAASDHDTLAVERPFAKSVTSSSFSRIAWQRCPASSRGEQMLGALLR